MKEGLGGGFERLAASCLWPVCIEMLCQMTRSGWSTEGKMANSKFSGFKPFVWIWRTAAKAILVTFHHCVGIRARKQKRH